MQHISEVEQELSQLEQVSNARNSENDLLNVQVDQFKTEWKSYATDVDTDAKGKWAAAAKKEITDQADRLDAIMPDMHILF